MEYICHECIGDEIVKSLLQKKGKRQKCRFCLKMRKSLSFEQIIELVNTIYRKYFVQGDYVANPFALDDKIEYSQTGENPSIIIQELLDCEINIAESIVDKLYQDEQYDVIKDGATSFYDESLSYIFKDIEPSELHSVWNKFQESIKHKKRSFDEERENILEELFFVLDYLDMSGTTNYKLYFNPKNNPLEIFRGRKAINEKKAEKILSEPENELNAPLPAIAKAGRLNPDGIPIFYGALNESTCIAEVKPNVGNYVTLGKFKITKKIKLLDLTVFNTKPPYRSLFTPSFDEDFANWMFFRNFQYLISQPILPQQEYLEYIPTQVVSEFISNILEYDGIIYSSSQIGNTTNDGKFAKNIAIFSDKNSLDFPLEYVKSSAKKVKVQSVRYEYEQDYF